MVALLLGLAMVAVPALIFHVACVGRSCEEADADTARVPFCSLDDDLRERIVAGFRDGRSPEVLGVARGRRVFGATGQPSPAWPSTGGDPIEVPIAFMGAGVDAGADVPDGTRVDAIAPTIADVIGLRRRHPEVRSGLPIEGIAAGDRPRLVVEIVMRGLTSEEIEANRSHLTFLGGLEDEGPATLAADPGSLPLDPTAVLTTIGTGGLPRQHGITGRHLRAEGGALVEAWSRRAPVSIIATLADDLDESTSNAAKIGLVGTEPSDLGLIGGRWYVDVDRDDLAFAGGAPRQVELVEDILERGYGNDRIPDLLAVALSGDATAADRAARRIASAARRTVPGDVTIVVAATGIAVEGPEAEHDTEIVPEVNERVGADVIEGTALGGFFVNQKVLAREGITEDEVVSAARRFEVPGGGRAFADVFPAISVSFARYCR